MLLAEQVQNEQMTTVKAQQFFSKRAKIYDLVFWIARPVTRSFLDGRDVLASNIKVLDAGTGTGLLTRILYSLAREKGLASIVFHAFDLTPAMLNKFSSWIRKQGAEDAISTQVENVLHLENLPETWNNYDLVVTASMLEYVPPESLHKAVAGLLGRLKPGGKMIWMLCARTPVMKFFVGWMWQSNLYTKSELDVVLAKAGVTDVEYLVSPPLNENKFGEGHMLLVEITRPMESVDEEARSLN